MGLRGWSRWGSLYSEENLMELGFGWQYYWLLSIVHGMRSFWKTRGGEDAI